MSFHLLAAKLRESAGRVERSTTVLEAADRIRDAVALLEDCAQIVAGFSDVLDPSYASSEAEKSEFAEWPSSEESSPEFEPLPEFEPSRNSPDFARGARRALLFDDDMPPSSPLYDRFPAFDSELPLPKVEILDSSGEKEEEVIRRPVPRKKRAIFLYDDLLCHEDHESPSMGEKKRPSQKVKK